MNVEGVWKIEMRGPYGWETIGTAFLKGGRYLGGSQHHYSIGSYETDGDKVVIKLVLTSFGERRILFGKVNVGLEVCYEGTIQGDTVIGQATEPGGDFSVGFRATKLSELS